MRACVVRSAFSYKYNPKKSFVNYGFSVSWIAFLIITMFPHCMVIDMVISPYGCNWTTSRIHAMAVSSAVYAVAVIIRAC